MPIYEIDGKSPRLGSGKIVAGSPADVVGNVGKRHIERLAYGHAAYLKLINSYHHRFKQI